ncbi:erythroid membrane-associated protein-like isoform X1 [Hemicordylus capensis]|uniref:erythroid membrane-associated protein-like isoform X1 n=1 Tax=Hemicordylus capensis TaxID=884348 RepID=UPI00230347A6|nr:erythroid membrane-associated protein-like isoform X1 [Hemicordylus capensis]XP_053118612.1 erythroid membrane-associated protein-like isoform X1 [Hemicordylus capensis]XP_053118613.1 erythroid membrane-associated protein-like isoform X1 [Hemicordylus capensis]
MGCCGSKEKHRKQKSQIEEEIRNLKTELEEKIMDLRTEYDELRNQLEECRNQLDWTRVRSNAANIMLAVDSAHPNLSIDAGDQKTFTYQAQPLSVSPNPKRFDGIVSVLGSQGFSSGQHYWEVDVSSSTDWDLGVVRESIQRKGDISLSPKEGFWLLGFDGKDYWARTDPWTRVTVKKKPSKIGVYLSFPEKELTFFNGTDMSVLFVFKHCSFSEDIYPFFKNTHIGTTIRIVP